MGLEWNQHQFMARIGGIVANNMERACNFAADEARARAPRLTGRLIENVDIRVEVIGKSNTIEGRVGVIRKIFWAWFQEVGTSKMAARPFLRPAVFNNAARLVRMIEGKE
jgi:HK97 gp10 family phage protein